MIQHRYTIHIARPVEQVFAYLTDSRHLRDWQSNLIEIQQLTDGPLSAGTRFREVRQAGSNRSEAQAEVTRFDAAAGQFSTRTLTKPQVTVDYSLHKEGDGTRLSYQFEMLTTGMAPAMEPIIAAAIQKDTSADIEKLKVILEAHPT
ncbi:MAG: SRPBCC family protein [Anaerolineae bacterium]